MNTAIYKAQVDTPFGLFEVAVLSTEFDARSDIYGAMQSEINLHPGIIRIQGDVRKSNRRVIRNMHPIKKCTSHTFGQWGWISDKIR